MAQEVLETEQVLGVQDDAWSVEEGVCSRQYEAVAESYVRCGAAECAAIYACHAFVEVFESDF